MRQQQTGSRLGKTLSIEPGPVVLDEGFLDSLDD